MQRKRLRGASVGATKEEEARTSAEGGRTLPESPELVQGTNIHVWLYDRDARAGIDDSGRVKLEEEAHVRDKVCVRTVQQQLHEEGTGGLVDEPIPLEKSHFLEQIAE